MCSTHCTSLISIHLQTLSTSDTRWCDLTLTRGAVVCAASCGTWWQQQGLFFSDSRHQTTLLTLGATLSLMKTASRGCDRRIRRKHRSTDSPACPERCLEPLGGLEADGNHDAAVCSGSRGAGNASTNVWHRVMDADPQFRPSSESGLDQNTVLWDTYADTHACS